MPRLKYFIASGFFVAGLIIILTATSQTVNRRMAALPLYIESTLNRLKPNVVIPTPPAVSAISPESLLAAAPGSNVPAYFNPDDLNPSQPANSANTVGLVISHTQAAAPVTPQVSLGGISHQWQTWNNCGPSTITMNLSFFGRPETQADSAQFLKPNRDDKNVDPSELAAYAQSLGFGATARMGGDLALLKQLLSNGFPVIVEFWTEPEDNGGYGHYRLFSGYDETGGYFIAQDSLLGPNLRVPIDSFDGWWRVFNRTYIVVYPPDKASLIQALLGPRMDDEAMLTHSLVTAQTEAQQSPNNAYTWFNMGTSYARLGQSELAASAFDQARRIGLPYRMLWYQFDIFDVYLAQGRYQDVIDLATATLQATGGLEELYYVRGLAHNATGQPDAATNDFRSALEYNPRFAPAAEALAIP
jgi:hypothetical protein